MNLPLQREPIQRSISSQATGDKDPTAAMLASGITPSEHGVHPDGWEDILGKVAGIALPALASMI
jgi:hypothetical protein